MAKKKMVIRNPLSQRQTIEPELLRPQPSTEVVRIVAKQQVSKETSLQSANNPGEKTSLKRYATYLQPETIKKIKHFSIDKGMTDYEVVQAAVDDYFKSHVS
jgi:hypothetical protein